MEYIHVSYIIMWSFIRPADAVILTASSRPRISQYHFYEKTNLFLNSYAAYGLLSPSGLLFQEHDLIPCKRIVYTIRTCEAHQCDQPKTVSLTTIWLSCMVRAICGLLVASHPHFTFSCPPTLLLKLVHTF